MATVGASECGTSGPKKCTFKWTDELTFTFIRIRAEKETLFTGYRNAATQGYEEIINLMDLTGKVTAQQCKKKWENLKKKYKDLSLPKTGSGTEEGEVTAANWLFYAAMHEAIGQRPSVRPVSLYSSGPKSAAVSPTQSEDAGGEEKEVEEEEESVFTAGEGTSSAVGRKRSGKRKRKEKESAAESLHQWCESIEKRQKEEDEQDRAWMQQAQGQMERMLTLFGKLVDHLTKT